MRSPEGRSGGSGAKQEGQFSRFLIFETKLVLRLRFLIGEGADAECSRVVARREADSRSVLGVASEASAGQARAGSGVDGMDGLGGQGESAGGALSFGWEVAGEDEDDDDAGLG
jgi:hypothetical protein